VIERYGMKEAGEKESDREVDEVGDVAASPDTEKVDQGVTEAGERLSQDLVPERTQKHLTVVTSPTLPKRGGQSLG